MKDNQISNYWADQAAEAVMAAHPEGEIIVSSGHSPSGYYHLGTLREILTASAIAWTIARAGRQVRHIDFVDDFDAFRKVPAGVPERWAEYLGQPLCFVPDPWECHESYASHFVTDLYGALSRLGVKLEAVYAHESYPAGKFTSSIEASLLRLPDAKQIVAEVSHRELPDDWAPVQILSDDNNLRRWKYAGWDQQRGVVKYTGPDGDGEVSYATGRVKLDWRLDWPARWAIWGVGVEPFGRDHATKGGSYDTGRGLVGAIFGGTAPFPVPYDFINRVGQTKKMSKSAGDVVTASDALDIMPPEILRYFVLKSQPSRLLFFDEGLGLFNLIDEYSKVEQAVHAGTEAPFAEAYHIAAAQTTERTISSIPFGHLVAVFQAARGDSNYALELLARTGFEAAATNEHEVIIREFGFVRTWLSKYAPESVKFSVQTDVPDAELTAEQMTFLNTLADTLQTEAQLNGQGMHDAIYAAAAVAGIKPQEGFKAIYRIILAKDSGPKAGWFLASLEKPWLISRLLLLK